MKDDRLYLIHISECISRIDSYSSEGKTFFLSDQKTQDAVLRNIQTLSESTQRLSDKFKNTHTAVDWRAIAGFRNVLVHGYLGVNIMRVWEIIEHDLPVLKKTIADALKSTEPGN